MSVWTYKKVDGEIISELLDVSLLDGQLSSGWTVDKASLEKPATKGVTKEEVDTNESGKLSSKEIRQAAKDAGIEGHETARIKTLEAELWPTPKAT